MYDQLNKKWARRLMLENIVSEARVCLENNDTLQVYFYKNILVGMLWKFK